MVTPTISDFAFSAFYPGVGSGLRITTPIGPIRLDLARRFHAPAVVTLTGDHPFRAAIATGDDPAAGCFEDITPPATTALGGDDADLLRVYRVSCP